MMKHSEKLKKSVVDPVTEWRLRFFRKIGIRVTKNQKVLDIGCGDGGDALIFANLGADVIGIDIKPHQNWQILGQNNLRFKISNSCNLPFKDESFDIVFEKDMLHHVGQIEKVLNEIKRVTKKRGQIVLIEANRYNPIFYLHMTLIKNHQHFTQGYFKKIISNIFSSVEFKTLEAHVYPKSLLPIFKVYELVMEKILVFQNFLAYNCAIIENDK